MVVPAEDAQGAEGVPAAGPVVAVFQGEVNPAGVSVLEGPEAIRLLLVANELDGFVKPGVGRMGGVSVAEVVEGAKDVVMPPWREGELEPGGADDVAGGFAAEQGAFEQILFGTAAGGF